MTNALPFDPLTWPEKQRAGWRFAVQYGPGERSIEEHYVGLTRNGRAVWQEDVEGRLVASKDPAWPLCKMLPPSRVLTFRVGLFRDKEYAWLTSYMAGEPSPELQNGCFVRWLTPSEMEKGKVMLDD